MKSKFILAFIAYLFLCPLAFAQRGESHWYLPMKLSDTNTQVRFELDSTWHMIHGTTSKISGTATLQDSNNPTEVNVFLRIPVAQFDTNSPSRDEELREVMHAAQFPYVEFHGTRLKNLCTPARVLSEGSCEDKLVGNLTIAKKTAAVEIPVKISRTDQNAFHVSGSIPIRWAEFGVDDPSIFIARVKPTVTVYFDVSLSNEHSS